MLFIYILYLLTFIHTGVAPRSAQSAPGLSHFQSGSVPGRTIYLIVCMYTLYTGQFVSVGCIYVIYIYIISYPRILHIESYRHVTKQHLFLHPHGLILTNAGLYMQQFWRQRWYSALLNPVVLSCFGRDQSIQGSSSGMRFFHDVPLTSLSGLYNTFPIHGVFSKVTQTLFWHNIDVDMITKALLASPKIASQSYFGTEPPPISNTLLAVSLHVLFGAAIVFTKEGTTGMVRAINLSLGSEVWYKAHLRRDVLERKNTASKPLLQQVISQFCQESRATFMATVTYLNGSSFAEVYRSSSVPGTVSEKREEVMFHVVIICGKYIAWTCRKTRTEVLKTTGHLVCQGLPWAADSCSKNDRSDRSNFNDFSHP